MKPDYKFGYHVIWMVPCLYLFIACKFTYDFFAKVFSFLKPKKKKSKEIETLTKLAGLK